MHLQALEAAYANATTTPAPFLPFPLLHHFLPGTLAPLLVVIMLAKPIVLAC